MSKHYALSFPHVTASQIREHARRMAENWYEHFSKFNPAKVGQYVEQKQITLCGLTVAVADLTDEGSDCPECSARLKSEMADEAQDDFRDYEMEREQKYLANRATQWADYPRLDEDLE